MRTLANLRIFILALIAALALATPAFAQTFPALTGRVVDAADILGAGTRTVLTRELAELEAKTTTQLVVVTIKSLQGHSIEDYGVRLGRAWQIGQKGKNNGALLIVAPTERKVRIEVGYGLEGELTDAVARLIIEERIVPNFRQNNMVGGVVSGTEAIVQVLGGDAANWQRRAAQAHPTLLRRFLALVIEGAFGVGGFLASILFVFLLGAVLSLASLAWLRVCLPVIVNAGIGLGLMSKDRRRWLARRQANWRFLKVVESGGGRSSGASGWSRGSVVSAASSGGGFSGGGGSFGGGGASGSW